MIMGRSTELMIVFVIFLIFLKNSSSNEIIEELDELFKQKLFDPLRSAVIDERKEFQNYEEKAEDGDTVTVTPQNKDPFWITLVVAGLVSLLLVPLLIIGVVIFCGKKLSSRLQIVQSGKEDSDKSSKTTYSPLPVSNKFSSSNGRSTTEDGGMERIEEADEIELGSVESKQQKPLDQRIDEISYDPKFEIDPVNLRLGTILGCGHFGKVCKGWLHRSQKTTFNDSFSQETQIPVAVKMPLVAWDQDQVDMLYAEVKIMTNIPLHPNVLTLIGAVTNREKSNNMFMVLEKCECNLQELLIRSKELNEPYLNELILLPPPPQAGAYVDNKLDPFYKAEKGIEGDPQSHKFFALSTSKLLSLGYQIAQGMEFLSSIPCLHRDLAARNVMITKDSLAKVSDFGLARKNDKEYYRVRKSVDQPIPVRWMSPEAIDFYFSKGSDVWAFGIVLFEMFSLGQTPYPTWGDEEVILRVKQGERNSIPIYCHKELFDFMCDCWHQKPLERPDFRKCVQVLENHLTRANPTMLNTLKSTLNREITRIEALSHYR